MKHGGVSTPATAFGPAPTKADEETAAINELNLGFVNQYSPLRRWRYGRRLLDRGARARHLAGLVFGPECFDVHPRAQNGCKR